MAQLLALQGTEESHPERHAEIQDHGVHNGNEHPLLAREAGDDRQGGIHGGGAAARDGGQRADPAYHERREKQCGQLAHDVGQQGHGAQLRALVLGDEDGRKGIIGKAGTHGQAFAEGIGQRDAGQGRPGKGAHGGG